jgi:hypothetical protein
MPVEYRVLKTMRKADGRRKRGGGDERRRLGLGE